MSTQQKEIAYVAKMSVRTLGCKPEGTATAKRLCQIYGKADGLKVGEDKVRGNVWTALTGSFAGINLETGDEFKSGKLFLPSGIQEVVENAVKEMLKADTGSTLSVKFGLEIRSIEAKNPIGYSYQAVNLFKVETTDELSEMRKAILEARAGERPSLPTTATHAPQIAAPAPAPAKGIAAPAPAKDKKK